ncbi:RNA polymerase sigma factor [Rhodopseudomonas sp. NSM]|uniref:RNA polymerase sigma factor n=1 Tax=Rhodopseudomonas sp. NSM TaxID=3457630 RepID=UPI004035C3D9
MSTTTAEALRELLIAKYDEFGRRLTRRLGSADLASDVLQETYLRLERISDIGPVRSPGAYLFKIALNIALDRHRAEQRRLTVDEVDALLTIPDDRPDAARVIEDRSEINLLRRAIAELPERRRRVLLLSRIDGLPHREIAERLSVTVRTVETDLKQAVEHCAERLKRHVPAKFGFPCPGSSYDQRRSSRRLAAGIRGKALDRGKTNHPHRALGSVDP